MADVFYTGAALAIAQVDSFTPATVETTDIFTLTLTHIDGRVGAVSFTATAATVVNVVDGLVAAWTAAKAINTLFAGITAVNVSDTHLTLTADVAGDEFSVASSTTDGGGADTQTLTRAVVTANTGPKDWANVDNWDIGAAPGGAANQDVYIANSGVELMYSLDQSGIANTLDSLNFDQTFTGKVGPNGFGGLTGDYLQIKTSALNIGQHYGTGIPAGSGRIKINLGTTQTAIKIENSGSAFDTGKPAIRLLNVHAASTLEVKKGSVGLAFETGEVSTILSADVNYVDNPTTDADLFLGAGVTITTITKTGGDLVVRAAATITTITNEAGTLKIHGTHAITTLNVKGGTVEPNSTGTITTLNATGGTTNFTKNRDARTVTTVKIDPGPAVIIYDKSVMTFTNDIAPFTAAVGVVTLTAG